MQSKSFDSRTCFPKPEADAEKPPGPKKAPKAGGQKRPKAPSAAAAKTPAKKTKKD